MNGIVLKFARGVAFMALGVSFVMLSGEAAFACHEVGFPSVPGNPGSPECAAAAAAAGGSVASAPEIGATGSLAALAAVGAIAMLMFERRRKR